jgi:Ran GTPase-activating protein (RanGAP) involved in mRNA processing and transport
LQSAVAATNVEPELASVITINVQSLSGALPPITLTSQATVRDLKLHLQTLNVAFAFDRLKLLIHDPDDAEAGVVLLNHRTLQSYEITGSTNVALVILSSPDVEVCIDDALKDSDAFCAMMENRDIHAAAVEVGSIASHREMLLQLLQVNDAIRSIRISGSWTTTQTQLQFCKELISARPDIDIKFVVNAGIMSTIVRIAEFCKLNRCSSIQLASHMKGKKCDQGYGALASALQWTTSFQTFELCNRVLDVEGCAALAPALQSMSSLLTLAIVDTEIGASGFDMLAPALQSMPSLRTLNLCCNRIGDEGCRGLALALQSMLSLHSLNIGFNQIGVEGCIALAPVLQKMFSLHSLDMSNNQIGVAGCVALTPALQTMSRMQTLAFRRTGLGASGCAALVPALQSMTSLQTLHFNANGIGDEGCVALAPALQSLPSLQTLDLCGNHIGDEGCCRLALVLQSMLSLHTLDLSCNRIGVEGSVALAPALQSMSSLQTLQLNGNRIRNGGCHALTPALQSISSLELLTIRGNRIDDEVLAALRSSISHLRILDFRRFLLTHSQMQKNVMYLLDAMHVFLFLVLTLHCSAPWAPRVC